jgi:hypothetical protein
MIVAESPDVGAGIRYHLTFPAGTRHVAEARVTYRLNERTRHTSVGRAIVMCP